LKTEESPDARTFGTIPQKAAKEERGEIPSFFAGAPGKRGGGNTGGRGVTRNWRRRYTGESKKFSVFLGGGGRGGFFGFFFFSREGRNPPPPPHLEGEAVLLVRTTSGKGGRKGGGSDNAKSLILQPGSCANLEGRGWKRECALGIPGIGFWMTKQGGGGEKKGKEKKYGIH